MPRQPALVKHGNWWKHEWDWLQQEQKKQDAADDDQVKAKANAEAAAASPAASISDKWRLVDLFLEYKGLVTQHIDSYNYFVTSGLKELMSAESTVLVRSEADPKWFLKYENIYVGKPSKREDMTTIQTSPQMCRLRDLTYSAPIMVDIIYWKGNYSQKKKAVEIGHMPVMLRSNLCVLHNKSDEEMTEYGECPYDPGGYFIIKGVERVLMMQEQPLANRIIVEYDSKKTLQAVCTSQSLDNKSRTLVCLNPAARKKGLYLKHSAFGDLVPVTIVLKAMGVQSDMEIVQMVGLEKQHLDSLMTALQEVHDKNIFSQKTALDYLSARLKTKESRKPLAKEVDALQVLRKQLLSHIECQDNSFAPKIRYLGLMVRRLINATHDERLIDDRDYYGNKRLELSGALVSLLFEDQIKSMNAELQKQADIALSKWHQQSAAKKTEYSTYPDVLDLWTDRSRLTKAMVNAISTGNWNIKRFKMERSGVSQVLSRFSFMSSLGSMMRVRSNVEKSRKVAGPRALQPSQWGMLCPADTPEGEQCGLVKHLSLLTHVTTGESEAPLRQLCYCLGVEDAHALSGEELHHVANYLVFLNGGLLGVHRRPRKFMSNMQHLRRQGRIGQFVSIYEHEGWHAIFIASDGGRLCRPLIIVQDGKPRFDPAVHVPMMMKRKPEGGMSFADFLQQGIVEWVDVNEENNLFIALHPDDIRPETTHLEIEPFTLLGVVSGLIPYPNHNQSPRNTYECAMGKQAMGCVAMNQFDRTDTLLLGLVYPQKPLCTSKTLNLVDFHHLGAGQNASVAVMSYSGYDIEDAIIMNRGSLDRGFGRCFVMRRTGVSMLAYQNGVNDMLAPAPAAGGNDKRTGMNRNQNLRYSILGEDGMAKPGEKVEDGFLLANKISPVETKEFVRVDNEFKYRATPVNYKNPVSSYIDRVILTLDGEGTRTYKVITRQTRRPEIGDKFASRHGQKGVVGLIVPEEDMPFSETGWRPDLIMNPHGFPSRMTVGKMLECIGSKAAVMEGVFANGSAFGGTPAEEIYRTLISHGFAPTGKEYLTSGITGEALESYIFCGPIYYQKLKHMVVDKMHARARGPRMVLTRQPTEGRAKEGGLRLGEMERDCLVAYGASNLLLERLMISSDACNPPICRRCGLFCGHPDWCKFCGSAEFVTLVRMPYACKLLFQEMQSMNVCCRVSLVER